MELKPCAHCGSEALVRKVDYYYEDGGLGMSAYEARCTECGARTLEYRDEDDAIEAWNRRATPDVDQMRDVMRRTIDGISNALKLLEDE